MVGVGITEPWLFRGALPEDVGAGCCDKLMGPGYLLSRLRVNV